MPRKASSQRPKSEWTQAFDARIQACDLEGAVALLDTMKTGHADTPPQAVKDKAVRSIQRAYTADPERLFAAGIALASSENAGAKEIGIYLLPPFYETATDAVNEQFIRLGDDANWEVREWAASALTYVTSRHFERVYPRLQRWAEHPSANVRRMVAVASGYAMRDCTEAQCERLLTLLTPLMADTDKYVSKNLGAFALGGYALRHCPHVVARWAATLELSDEQTASNLAMMLTGAEASKQLEVFQRLLTRLVRDDRRRVRCAVEKALIQLEKRNRSAFDHLLRAWDASPDTRELASLVRALCLDD